MIFRQLTHDDLGCASDLIGDEDAGVAAVYGTMRALTAHLVPLSRRSRRQRGRVATWTTATAQFYAALESSTEPPTEARMVPSLTTVLTAAMSAAESTTASSIGMIADWKGIDTEQPRMPSARTPPIAAATWNPNEAPV